MKTFNAKYNLINKRAQVSWISSKKETRERIWPKLARDSCGMLSWKRQLRFLAAFSKSTSPTSVIVSGTIWNSSDKYREYRFTRISQVEVDCGHTATHCSTTQHTATLCITLQHTAADCNTLQHIATHCSTLYMYICVGTHVDIHILSVCMHVSTYVCF